VQEVAELAAEVRAGGALSPRESRPIAGVAERAARPTLDPNARAFDKRGREIESDDPILFAAAGPFAGVYLGRYAGRDPATGRMVAVIDQGEPRAGERAAALPGSTIRARAEDVRAEVRASIAREIMVLEGRAL
jgi:hypothetical protein